MEKALAPKKDTQKITPVLTWLLPCLDVTPGTASAFLGP